MYTKLSIGHDRVQSSIVGRRVKGLCDRFIDGQHDRVNAGSDVMAFNALDGGVVLQFSHTLTELPFDLTPDDVVQVHIVYTAGRKGLDPDSSATYKRGTTWADVAACSDGSASINVFASSIDEANKLLRDVQDRCSVRLNGLERI
ncbi:MAG: hypothetical protein ABI303_00410 [Candidatus Saccharimonas sp.]